MSGNRASALKLRGERGVALVVVLSVIVFVAILVALFLTTTTLNRQLSFSSAGQTRAENVAMTALETTLGDLRSEIAAGSTNSLGTPTIYFPITNSVMVPYRVGDNGFTNVVKRSVSSLPFWQGPAYQASIAAPVRSAGTNSTASKSANGRYVRTERWNAPYLMGDQISTNFQSPDWIIVTRSGAITNAASIPALSVLSNPQKDNAQYAIGRYAYMIYDEGGLLDVTVAGFPAGASVDFTARRGLLPQVNLGLIPGVNNAPALVNWRNEASRSGYETKMLTNTNGFTEAEPGDRTFFSRQDLITYAKKHPEQLGLSALQHLATFNRTLNAPSYTPDPSRPKVGSQDDDINPSLIDTRVTTTFTRDSDGQAAVVGEPLLKYRFPLSRLGLFTQTGPEVAAAIQKYFGLTRATPSQPWSYRSGASRILTLEEVATAGREPDFFELLQAGITFGSLGSTFPKQSSDVIAQDSRSDVQVIQIGANLIDQYDENSIPTRISYGNSSYEISGIENLPYLTRIYEGIYRLAPSTVGMWLIGEVWNPHAALNVPSDAPTQFRLKARGQNEGLIMATDGPHFVGPKDLADSEGISFSTAGNTYALPTVLSPSIGATATGDDSPGTFVGLSLGSVTIQPGDLDAVGATNTYGTVPRTPVDYELQYFDSSIGDYVTYDRIRRVDAGAGSRLVGGIDSLNIRSFFIRSDPRVDRFGVFGGYDNPAPGSTVRPDTGPGVAWNGIYIGLFADNLSTSLTRYADPDGQIRPADGAYTRPASTSGYPLMTSVTTSRPVILNRPFRSVAEMGYASRGAPWKHLDFFHPSSGDMALLDIFSISEPAFAQSAEPRTEAGKVNLNGRDESVLNAVLTGSAKNEAAGNPTVVSATEVNTFRQGLLDVTDENPLLNKSELVTKLMAVLPSANADSIIKRRRESVVRSLADIGDTRTWNLLIDVIAQSGRYPTDAQDLNKFQVDGERRYWLHVAIDRFTGRVVARKLELVNE